MIKRINPEETYLLRREILRKNLLPRQFYRETSVFGRNSDRYDRIYHSFQNPSHRYEDNPLLRFRKFKKIKEKSDFS